MIKNVLFFALIVILIAPVAWGTTAQNRLNENTLRGDDALACGDLFYDDGVAENTIFFGGGDAGRPDHFLGIRFELADFNIAPGTTELTGFCVSNRFDLTALGGPWPNEVFVYRDLNGLPDIDNPQRQATMLTGDGTGFFETNFDQPWLLDEPVFWLLVRGDPVNEGEDFNVESDQSSEPTGNSWITDRGLSLIFQTGQNLMLRANIQASLQSTKKVPSLSLPSLLLLCVLIIVLAAWVYRQSRLDVRG
ncbi:MAG: hypothetical protein AAF446_06050 [Pseudomonadota bacterium]